MSPVFILILFIAYKSATARNQRDFDYLSSLHVYSHPAYLPILPYYQIEIPEQEGKFFHGAAVTKYETIIVRETVRPVCLFIDGNVPSCDHIHDYDYRPKNPTAEAYNGGRPTTEVDYESYLVEPSKPNGRIEITEIPFRGTFLLTGTSVETDDGHTAADHETPALPSVRPVTGDVRYSNGGQRQFLQTALSATGLGVAVANIAGAGNSIANAVGLGGLSGAAIGLNGAAIGLNGAVNSLASVAGGGGRPQVTIYVTRVEKVVDDRVTATLVPKNCVPMGSRVDLLIPCAATVPLYPQPQPPLPGAQPKPPLVSVGVMSKENVPVEKFIDVHHSAVITTNR